MPSSNGVFGLKTRIALLGVLVAIIAIGFATGAIHEVNRAARNQPSEDVAKMAYDAGYSCGKSIPDVIAKAPPGERMADALATATGGCDHVAQTLHIAKRYRAAFRRGEAAGYTGRDHRRWRLVGCARVSPDGMPRW